MTQYEELYGYRRTERIETTPRENVGGLGLLVLILIWILFGVGGWRAFSIPKPHRDPVEERAAFHQLVAFGTKLVKQAQASGQSYLVEEFCRDAVRFRKEDKRLGYPRIGGNYPDELCFQKGLREIAWENTLGGPRERVKWNTELNLKDYRFQMRANRLCEDLAVVEPPLVQIWEKDFKAHLHKVGWGGIFLGLVWPYLCAALLSLVSFPIRIWMREEDPLKRLSQSWAWALLWALLFPVGNFIYPANFLREVIGESEVRRRRKSWPTLIQPLTSEEVQEVRQAASSAVQFKVWLLGMEAQRCHFTLLTALLVTLGLMLLPQQGEAQTDPDRSGVVRAGLEQMLVIQLARAGPPSDVGRTAWKLDSWNDGGADGQSGSSTLWVDLPPVPAVPRTRTVWPWRWRNVVSKCQVARAIFHVPLTGVVVDGLSGNHILQGETAHEAHQARCRPGPLGRRSAVLVLSQRG